MPYTDIDELDAVDVSATNVNASSVSLVTASASEMLRRFSSMPISERRAAKVSLAWVRRFDVASSRVLTAVVISRRTELLSCVVVETSDSKLWSTLVPSFSKKSMCCYIFGHEIIVQRESERMSPRVSELSRLATNARKTHVRDERCWKGFRLAGPVASPRE
jgi:hypothetical protein